MSQPQYLAASVRQRLLNVAQSQQENFNLVLTRYGIERLLYRLTQSPSGDRFILKGAMLFTIWSDTPHRMTKDVDLLSRGDNSIENIETIFREICRLEVVPDGLTFNETTVKGTLIKADREYPGVRILLTAFITNTRTRIDLQVDVGFGDVVTPTPQLVNLPTILPDFPAAQLYAYSKETVIAEKFEAMVLLGIGNTRMKDFYDLWYLSRNFTFQGDLLCQAIIATFDRRRTPIPTSIPLALSSEFANDETKQRQWLAFVRKGKLSDDNLVLPLTVSLLQDFLLPPMTAIVQKVPFNLLWSTDIGWHSNQHLLP